MTVYTPGGPCLTRLQHEQQLFQKQLQEKSNPSPAKAIQNLAAGRTPADTLGVDAVGAVEKTEQSIVRSSATHGQFLNITL